MTLPDQMILTVRATSMSAIQRALAIPAVRDASGPTMTLAERRDGSATVSLWSPPDATSLAYTALAETISALDGVLLAELFDAASSSVLAISTVQPFEMAA